MNTYRTKINSADLFCGGGGFTEGLLRACRELAIDIESHTCVNHAKWAILTHRSNHEYARHICDKLNTVDPVDIGRLDVVLASPECTHFSNARGAAPVNDQKRIPAGSVPGWIENCRPAFFCIENVREFEKWGEMGANGKPKKDGKLFLANVVEPLRALGYSVEWKVLNCADYGDPTTRQRLFILGRRDGKPVEWPAPTHDKAGANGLKTWIPAREIIDWSLPSQSIFTRKKPLAKNTLARIEAGIRKFWGEWAEPFLIVLKGTTKAHVEASAKHLDDPVPALCAGGTHMGIVEPFILGQHSGGAPRGVGNPLMTVCTESRGIGLAEPFLVEQSFRGAGDNLVRSTDRPAPTLLTKQHLCLCEPFLTIARGKSTVRGADDPVPTLTTGQHFGVVEPFLMQNEHGGRSYNLGKPMPTVTANGRAFSMCEPFIVQYYSDGSGKNGHSVNKPLPTVTCRDRFGVVQQFGLDIHYRMLQPHELAAAMGFPSDYLWYGNKTQIVRQIGNAVPVNTAKALIKAMIKQTIHKELTR